jgi:hypothetical protein
MTARLYFRGFDANALAGVFAREGHLVGKKALRQMRLVSKLVMQQSIRNAPVDWKGPHGAHSAPEHELERAHHLDEDYGNLGRLEATVWVGGMVGDVNVDLYARWIHESFDYRLGPASEAKAMRGPEYKVGPLFLERALAEYDSEFEGGQVWDRWLDDVVEGFAL